MEEWFKVSARVRVRVRLGSGNILLSFFGWIVSRGFFFLLYSGPN